MDQNSVPTNPQKNDKFNNGALMVILIMIFLVLGIAIIHNYSRKASIDPENPSSNGTSIPDTQDSKP